MKTSWKPFLVQVATLAYPAFVMSCSSVSEVSEFLSPPMVVSFERFHRMGEASRIHGGEILLGELGCTNCHLTSDVRAQRVLARQAPILDRVGSRIRFAYLQDFLAQPHRVKPGTLMPDLLSGWEPGRRDAAAESLAQFLSSQGGPILQFNFDFKGQLVDQGEELFHTVGCVACHAPFRPSGGLKSGVLKDHDAVFIKTQHPKLPSVPLGNQLQKTTLESLTNFLTNPIKIRPSGRMPPMGLEYTEARATAAYLLSRGGELQDQHSPSLDFEKVRKGRILFRELQCPACHRLEIDGFPVISSLVVKRFKDLDLESQKSCLDPSPGIGIPDFNLDEFQRVSLLDAVARLQENISPLDPESQVRQSMELYNCFSCHRRGEQGGPEAGRAAYFVTLEELDLGNEGRLPPPLTSVGRKLKPAWLRRVLEGSGRVRPYMAVRMPNYSQVSKTLAREFTRADENLNLPVTDVSGSMPHHRNRFGRHLMGASGLNCINCHNLRGHRSTGMPAMDLATTPERLEPDWFKQFLLNPETIRPGTLMPAFYEGGKGTLTEVLDGDPDKQIESILVYLKELEQTRLPEGIEQKDIFELIPRDNPIILRTFLEGVGTHAIAVGFSHGIHSAFDALQVRFSLFWRGRFLNAESTWSNRFSPFAKPLSQDHANLPEIMPLAILESEKSSWPTDMGKKAGYRMQGFRIESSGEPTFLYSFQGIEVEERVVPMEDGRWFERTFDLRGEAASVWLLLGRARKIQQESQGTYVAGNIRIRLRDPEALNIVLRKRVEGEELIIPLRFQEGRSSVRQELTW